jgi:polyisoprenoid-binding protein YceI
MSKRTAALLCGMTLAFGLATGSSTYAADGRTSSLAEVKSGTYTLEHDHARVVWSISHRGFSTFSALFSDVQGTLKFDSADPTKSQLDATVNMNSVGTLIPAFDERLKGEMFFNTGKYPTSTFHSTRIERTGANQLRVSGDLTFLGITKPAVLEATFLQAGAMRSYVVGFDGRMTFKRSDFGMPISEIGDEVNLMIEAEFE